MLTISCCKMHWIVVSSIHSSLRFVASPRRYACHLPLHAVRFKDQSDHAIREIVQIDRSTDPVQEDEAGGLFGADRVEQQPKRADDGNEPRFIDVFFGFRALDCRVPNTVMTQVVYLAARLNNPFCWRGRLDPARRSSRSRWLRPREHMSSACSATAV